MTVRTLSRWVDRLLKGSVMIECPRMEILGRDHEPPVFTGPGHIKVGQDKRIRFVMHGTPRDGSDAFKRIVLAQKYPHDIRHQFRINATAYDGTEWSGGWTKLTLGEEAANIWQLSGPIHSLHTDSTGFGVAKKSGVELVFDRSLRLPIPMNMVKTVLRGDKQVFWARSSGTKTINVLDAEIEFFLSPEHEHVWAVANTTQNFPHPHLENWLSEPLNLLLGEIVVPSLCARNFGDGRAFIRFRPSPWKPATTLTASILREDPLGADERFWNLYCDILTIVATARDADGHPNFEAHPLTQYYWEIVQASGGSNWVLCMTLASTVEGIAKAMFSETEWKADWATSEVDSLKQVVKDWKGDSNLRSRVLDYLNGFKKKGIAKVLKSLVEQGIVTSDQVDAWSRIRNSSMHGDMVLPWSDEDQEGRIINLIELTHRLSEAYIKRELGKVTA
ncbi:hypothetical protein SLW56_19165 [Xanthomonas sp. LF07-6]|uniref:hypothetical protein n=1 Tax=Xanthomonas sp. LF07-6 TaxID=3097550 RepID=UPI002A821200|nr:hypothetical protein [Xanthomonas sp. LF07-6]MDY4341907.1 hypothetical protein [Xanthomonas sp. LF07-6]